jgi:hypothetical protein
MISAPEIEGATRPSAFAVRPVAFFLLCGTVAPLWAFLTLALFRRSEVAQWLSLTALSLVGPFYGWLIFRSDPYFAHITRIAFKDGLFRDRALKRWPVYPFKPCHEKQERQAFRVKALVIAALCLPTAFIGFLYAPAGLFSSLQSLALPAAAIGWVAMLRRSTVRVPRWEGRLRMEKVSTKNGFEWVQRGNPLDDDAPRVVYANDPGPAGPGKARFERIFNDRTGQYEYVQTMAAEDGDPNLAPEAPPFAPKGEYGDTPDVKPEGEFI